MSTEFNGYVCNLLQSLYCVLSSHCMINTYSQLPFLSTFFQGGWVTARLSGAPHVPMHMLNP